MEKEFDGIIFDIDGTLWDVRGCVAKVWEEIITKYTDWPITFDKESIGAMFGKTMDTIFFHFYPDSTTEEYEKISSLIYARQEQYLREAAPPLYEGVKETIIKLSEKYRLYIVTNAQSGYIETIFDVHNLKQYFNDWLCFGDTGTGKGETMRRLISRNGLKAAVYIGDTQGDADACDEAGIPIVYASYGLGTVCKPWRSIGKFAELLNIFMG